MGHIFLHILFYVIGRSAPSRRTAWDIVLWIQPRRVLCDRCTRRFVALTWGIEKFSQTGAASASDAELFDKIHPRVANFIAKRNRVGQRPIDADVRCPGCGGYPSSMVRRSWAKHFTRGAIGFVALALYLIGASYSLDSTAVTTSRVSFVLTAALVCAVIYGVRHSLPLGRSPRVADPCAKGNLEFDSYVLSCTTVGLNPAVEWFQSAIRNPPRIPGVRVIALQVF